MGIVFVEVKTKVLVDGEGVASKGVATQGVDVEVTLNATSMEAEVIEVVLEEGAN